MVKLSLGKLAAAVGGVAVAFSAAAGVASADPLIDTSCNMGQVMAAVNDPSGPLSASPDLRDKFVQSPVAQNYLSQFLAAPPAKRAQMAQQIQTMPPAYRDAIYAVARVCSGY